MKRFATSLSLLIFLCPLQTLALSFQGSGTDANKCDGLARACTAAARELKAARELIAGYENQITAADARIEIALKEIDSLRKLSMLSEARAQELGAVIKAEREAKVALVALKAELEARVGKLEKKLSRSRKFGFAAAAVAVVAVAIVIAK